MTRKWIVLLLTVALGATACRRKTPSEPGPLFESRVPLAPLEEKLHASGADAKRILHPKSVSDLLLLTPDHRYKFVVLSDGALAIAPLPADAPANEYVHPILARGQPVRTAGGLRIERDGSSLTKIALDQDSASYCPSVGSLSAALSALAAMGVSLQILRVENRPPVCAGATVPPATEHPRYGALMAEVGQRFEMMGRAAQARRYELAEFELEELEEVFEEDLPKAEPPRVNAGVDLAGVSQAFLQTNVPDLEKSLKSRKLSVFADAFARAAVTCNGCHRASGHAFLEIPDRPGSPVPVLAPVR